jgi:hypothetical protein
VGLARAKPQALAKGRAGVQLWVHRHARPAVHHGRVMTSSSDRALLLASPRVGDHGIP